MWMVYNLHKNELIEWLPWFSTRKDEGKWGKETKEMAMMSYLSVDTIYCHFSCKWFSYAKQSMEQT